MSLDLDLVAPNETEEPCTCQECGHTHTRKTREVYFESNITHNLNKMFQEAGLYEILWHGTGLKAEGILITLERGLAEMKSRPEVYKVFDADNGWGTYPQAVKWLASVIEACRKYPDAVLRCGT
jgi:hypothetical protein